MRFGLSQSGTVDVDRVPSAGFRLLDRNSHPAVLSIISATFLCLLPSAFQRFPISGCSLPHLEHLWL